MKKTASIVLAIPALMILLGAAVLATTAVTANASTVSVTADFTQLTMGGFYSGGHTYAAGLSANGQAINVCGGDPNCTSAINNPASITASLTGSSVAFGYDQNLFTGPILRMNTFSFTGNSSADVTGTGSQNQFTVGSFTFTNGMFYPLVFLDFTLTTHSTDAAYDNHTFTGRIRLDTNSTSAWSGSDDPTKTAEADYFTVEDSAGSTLTSLGSVRVFDYNVCLAGDPSAPNCNTGSVDVIGYIASLHLASFANPTGGAFLNSSTTSTLAPNNIIPEPSTILLLGAGLAGLGVWGRMRGRGKC
jgi:hypothetical protein